MSKNILAGTVFLAVVLFAYALAGYALFAVQSSRFANPARVALVLVEMTFWKADMDSLDLEANTARILVRLGHCCAGRQGG